MGRKKICFFCFFYVCVLIYIDRLQLGGVDLGWIWVGRPDDDPYCIWRNVIFIRFVFVLFVCLLVLLVSCWHLLLIVFE